MKDIGRNDPRKGPQTRIVEIELAKEEPCRECGALGAHYCTGGQDSGVIWVGKRTER